MRTLSKGWNYDIITTSPDYLPRIIYRGFEVLIVSCSLPSASARLPSVQRHGDWLQGKGHGYRLTKDGYVHGGDGGDGGEVEVDVSGWAIQDKFSRFSRCCKEIKVGSQVATIRL
jgi:hypothetical protein